MAFSVDTYLYRLGFLPSRPSAAFLRELQRAHQRQVPIENFDIFLNAQRTWNTEALYKKIIGGRRGGLGLELNALFGELLTRLGFRSVYVAIYPEAMSTEKPMHMAMVVNIEGDLWLSDVGREEDLFDPVLLKDGGAALNYTRYVRMQSLEDKWWAYQTSKNAVNFKTQFAFQLRDSKLIEFLHLHDELQTLYASDVATEKKISRVRDTGRLSLTPMVSEIRQAGEVVFTETVHNEQDFDRRLQEDFGIDWRQLV